MPDGTVAVSCTEQGGPTIRLVDARTGTPATAAAALSSSPNQLVVDSAGNAYAVGVSTDKHITMQRVSLPAPTR